MVSNFLGRWVYIFLWFGIKDIYGQSFHLLIWIVFTVQDKVMANILHFCTVNIQVSEDPFYIFFPRIPWTSFLPAYPAMTLFFHSQITKTLQTHNWKLEKALWQRHNLCIMKFKKGFSLSLLISVFLLRPSGSGVPLQCQHSGLWKSWMVSEPQSGRNKPKCQPYTY